MTVRTVGNQTVRTVKRSVVVQANEVAELAVGFGTHTGENHPNILTYDGGAATVWFYPGYEHIPHTTTQGGTTAP